MFFSLRYITRSTLKVEFEFLTDKILVGWGFGSFDGGQRKSIEKQEDLNKILKLIELLV